MGRHGPRVPGVSANSRLLLALLGDKWGLSDSERPRPIWRTRLGSPNAFMPKVVGLRPVRRRNALTRELELLLQRLHARSGEGPVVEDANPIGNVLSVL